MCTFILYCLTLIYENWTFFPLRFLELTIWCSHQLRFLLQVQFVWGFFGACREPPWVSL